MKQRRFFRAKLQWLAVAGVMFAAQPASVESSQAAPMFFGSNAYEYVEVLALPLTNFTAYPQNSWQSAQVAAGASSFMGVAGHLATITSQAENDFVASLVSSNPSGFIGAWLGGKAPEGWLAGPENSNAFTYTNWTGVEPNNSGYAYMSIGTSNTGLWFDDSVVPISGDGQGIPTAPNDPVIGYFIEYEGVAPVPLPGTVALFTMALAGLALATRRRKAS